MEIWHKRFDGTATPHVIREKNRELFERLVFTSSSITTMIISATTALFGTRAFPDGG